MSDPSGRAVDVLLLDGPQGLSAGLARLLTGSGARVDLVRDLAELRIAFFQRGGHDALVIGPDVPSALAGRAVHSVRELDPRVRVVAFGRLDGERHAARIHQLGLHPASRAAAVAVLRAIRA